MALNFPKNHNQPEWPMTVAELVLVWPGACCPEPSRVGPLGTLYGFASTSVCAAWRTVKHGLAVVLIVSGIAARVIEPPAKNEASRYPYLVESLFLRSRWWVNELGEPDNIYSPRLIPRSHDDTDYSHVSGGK